MSDYKGLVDDIVGNLNDQTDIEKLALERLPFVERLIKDFTESYKVRYPGSQELLMIEDAGQKLSLLYFGALHQNIKHLVEDKANRFKLAAIMELCIVREQIFSFAGEPPQDEKQNREVNAIFGLTAALSFVNCFIKPETKEIFCTTFNVGVNERVDKLLDDHRTWLATKKLSEFPVIINAQFFESLEIIGSCPLQIHG